MEPIYRISGRVPNLISDWIPDIMAEFFIYSQMLYIWIKDDTYSVIWMDTGYQASDIYKDKYSI